MKERNEKKVPDWKFFVDAIPPDEYKNILALTFATITGEELHIKDMSPLAQVAFLSIRFFINKGHCQIIDDYRNWQKALEADNSDE